MEITNQSVRMNRANTIKEMISLGLEIDEHTEFKYIINPTSLHTYDWALIFGDYTNYVMRGNYINVFRLNYVIDRILPPKEPGKITITPDSLSLTLDDPVGEVEVTADNLKGDWVASVSDDTVASISANANKITITAIKVGNTTLTVTGEGLDGNKVETSIPVDVSQGEPT